MYNNRIYKHWVIPEKHIIKSTQIYFRICVQKTQILAEKHKKVVVEPPRLPLDTNQKRNPHKSTQHSFFQRHLFFEEQTAKYTSNINQLQNTS